MESIINGYQKLGISSDGPATSVRSVIGNAEIDSVSDSGNGVREEGQPSGTGDSDSNVESPTGDNIPEDETGREGQGSSEINEPVNVEEHDGLPRDSGSGPTVNLERESESALGF
jgi:hypothetical protein